MSIISTFLLLCLSEPETLFLFTPDFSVASSMDGRPRPGLPSGKVCCKQSDPEQSGCPSVWWLLDVYVEPETPSTQHRRLRLLRSSKTGETSGVCLRSQAKLITQSKALRYQIRLRSMKVNVSSPNHFANFFARSSAYSFVMSSSMAISYTPEYQVENLSPVHM